MTRKEFLTSAALATTATLAHPFVTYAKPPKYRTALIGSGWWGMNILREAIASGEIQVVALCDVDSRQMQKANEEISKLCTDKPKFYKDFRELLHTEKPDIVINATPDHWHALIAIEAMRSGSHLFIEKPISHTLNEGKAIVKTAHETGRICVVDFHRRYSPHNISAMNFLKSGKAGKISQVRAFVNYNWGEGRPSPVQEPPKELDWDFWCGPAPLVDYRPEIHPRGFRQHLEFANGQLGDWGPHWFDQILWWSGQKAPRKITSTASVKNIRNSTINAPETQSVLFEFEDFTCTWEHSLLNEGRPNEHNVGVFFYGTAGTFHLGWLDGWTFYPTDKNKAVLKEAPQLNQPDAQNIRELWADFMQAIKNKRQPFADIEAGHRATSMCLLGMAALKNGGTIEWDAQKQLILNNSKANQFLSREYRGEWKYPT